MQTGSCIGRAEATCGHYRRFLAHKSTRSGQISLRMQASRASEARCQLSGQVENSSDQQTVAIIGAGPAGLVAAKRLLDMGLTPTVFEKNSCLGGLWSPAAGLWTSLHTNLSRFTCNFPDSPWPADSAVFPSSAEVYSYLHQYASRFLHGPDAVLRYNAEVFSVEPAEKHRPLGDFESSWVVRWRTPAGVDSEEVFDKVVIATGFFSKPHLPSIPGLDAFPGVAIHSSAYRSPEPFARMRVAVVGASLSAAEVAAEVATCAASVTQVAPRPFWVLPRYLPMQPDSPSTPFLPLDLVLYRRSDRASLDEVSLPDDAASLKANTWLRGVCGDQGSRLAQPLAVPDTARPHVTVSDTYGPMVRSGRVQIARGRLGAIQGSRLLLEDGTALMEDADAVIFCTGYRTELPFLSASTLAQLGFDPADRLMPLLLHRSVFHPQLPGLGFVGMYRGPYFGVMDLQARWLAATFAGRLPTPSEAVQREGIQQEARIRALRPRPQLPHGDYVGLITVLARELGVHPADDWCRGHEVVLPSDFTGDAADTDAASAELAAAVRKALAGSMVPRTVFRALQGSWQVHRRLESRSEGLPSGSFSGSASFTMTSACPDEYLYSEEGRFTTSAGYSMPARKQYIYKYVGSEDRIDVHFAPGDLTSKGFFHSLSFLPAAAQGDGAGVGGQGGWRATGQHLCVCDMYRTSYRFAMAGINLAEFEVRHDVQGPGKDYTSTTVYQQQALASQIL